MIYYDQNGRTLRYEKTVIEIIGVYTHKAMTFSVLPAFMLSASAATLTVTEARNSGAGSLRGINSQAADGDTIVFDSSITSYAPRLNAPLTIGDKSLTIDASSIPSMARLNLFASDTAISCNAEAQTAAGSNRGRSKCRQCHLPGCYLRENTASNGGAIWAQCSARLFHTTKIDNAVTNAKMPAA